MEVAFGHLNRSERESLWTDVAFCVGSQAVRLHLRVDDSWPQRETAANGEICAGANRRPLTAGLRISYWYSQKKGNEVALSDGAR